MKPEAKQKPILVISNIENETMQRSSRFGGRIEIAQTVPTFTLYIQLV